MLKWETKLALPTTIFLSLFHFTYISPALYFQNETINKYPMDANYLLGSKE